MKVACYLDTNTFLHYRQFDQIDWCTFLDVDEILLIIPYVVISELDKQKLSANAKIRKRASRIISKLSSLSRSESGIASVKDSVSLYFCVNEPLIDFAKNGLSLEIADDRIIASILSQSPGEYDNTILITADFGLTLKAQSRHITCKALPNELLIKPSKSKIEIENEKLKERIAELENRIPELNIKIEHDNQLADTAKYTLVSPKPFDKNSIRTEISKLEQELKYKQPSAEEPMAGIARMFMASNTPSDEDIKRYEIAVNKYLDEYLEFYNEKWRYVEYLSRSFKIRLVLINNGTSPAENINMFLHFPDGFELLSEEEMREEPRVPAKPHPPRGWADMLESIARINVPSFDYPSSRYESASQYLNRGPQIKKTNSYDVNYSETKLQHRLKRNLDPLYVVFDDIKEARSFSIDYKILADNVPEPVIGKLNVVISAVK